MAVPNGNLVSDHSKTSLTGASETLVEQDMQRSYIFIQNCNATNDIGVNFTGGVAAIGAGGTVTIPAGKAWWSDQFVPTNKITVIGTITEDVTCYTSP